MWAQVKQVAAGGMHSVVLPTSGKVFTAGVNDEGPLGRPTGRPLLVYLLHSSMIAWLLVDMIMRSWWV